MGSILSALFSAIMNGFLKLFMISPEQKLGRLEVENEDAKKTNAGLVQALAVSDRVDRDPDPDRLLDDLNKRP